MGKRALEGLDGVIKVTRGFRGFKEINTVTYDPVVISVDKMVSALKAAGTYIGSANNKEKSEIRSQKSEARIQNNFDVASLLHIQKKWCAKRENPMMTTGFWFLAPGFWLLTPYSWLLTPDS